MYRAAPHDRAAPEIVVQRVPFDGLLSKLITAAIAKETPDICRVDVGHIGRLGYGGIAAPLDEAPGGMDLTDLLPIAAESNRVTLTNMETGQLETHLYGLSDQVTCVALYYNKAMLRDAGIEAPPHTLEELATVGKRLSDPAKGVYGLGLNNSLWWNLPFLYLFGADVISADNVHARLGEPMAASAFSYLRQLYVDGVEGGAWRAGAINPDQGFVNSRYAMVLSGPWNLKTFRGVDYGVALIPGTGSTPSATNIGGTSMIVLNNSTKKAEAARFLRYLTSYAAQKC